jgi:hypothetical protein
VFFFGFFEKKNCFYDKQAVAVAVAVAGLPFRPLAGALRRTRPF